MLDLLFIIINTILCLSFVFYNIRLLKIKQEFYIFPLTNIFIIVSNGLGIPLIKYSNRTFSLSYNDNDDIYFIAFFVILVFMIVCTIYQNLLYNSKFFKYRKEIKNHQYFFKPHQSIFFWFFLLISILGSIQFLFWSNGISYLGLVFNLSMSDYEYYTNRVLVGADILNLPGSILAFISSSFINPTLMLVIVYLERKIPRNNNFIKRFWGWIIIFYLSGSSALISLIFAKRFMMIFALIFPLIVIYLRTIKDDFLISSHIIKSFSKKSAILKIISLFLILSIIPTSVFSLTSGENIANSYLSLIERSIIVPAATNNYYYDTFPNKLDYRGIEKIGKMGKINSDDVTYQDIGMISEKRSFVPNSFFLAIAYSGAGILGVFSITVIYCLICTFHDYFFRRIDRELKTLLLIANFYGIYALASVPLQTAISSYGFISSTGIALLSIKNCRVTKNRNTISVN